MQIALAQIVVSPGSPVTIENVNWEMYEQILAEFGHERQTRINYSAGTIEIMAPLPEHEIDKVIIGDFVKAILEELDLEFVSLASTTFKSQEMRVGLEPDDCFYIKNEALMRGKKRIDLAIDPPPELAIEIDITARTRLDIYQALAVNELWRFDGKKLQIYVLQNGEYVESQTSPSLKGLALVEVIPIYLEMSINLGRNATIRRFRSWLKQQSQGANQSPDQGAAT